MSDKITDDGSLLKYYAAIPHLIDDANLTVYAYRLYGHMKRVAGERDAGACFQSTTTLAKHCNMSGGSVSKAKKELAAAGLIQIEKKNGAGGIHDHITITDIWVRNMNAFVKRSPHERQHSPNERQRSPHEPKNNPVKKNTFKKKEKAEILFTAVTIPDELSGSVEFSNIWFQRIEHRIELKKPYTERAAKMTLNKLSAYGVETAIEALRAAIENDWQGVFPEKSNGGGNGRKSQAVLRKEESDNNIRNIIQGMATGD